MKPLIRAPSYHFIDTACLLVTHVRDRLQNIFSYSPAHKNGICFSHMPCNDSITFSLTQDDFAYCPTFLYALPYWHNALPCRSADSFFLRSHAVCIACRVYMNHYMLYLIEACFKQIVDSFSRAVCLVKLHIAVHAEL